LRQTNRQAVLVSHTHWDLEWYLPFHRFRVNMVEVIDRVLDALEEDPEFRHFVLDGQSAVLEDYLAAAPHQRARVARHIQSGRLAVGPWYILPDEFLVSGEATVRNLLFGHRVVAPFGGVQKVGYMPDSFGHVAQIPQILQLAGIDSFIFTRGLGDEADRLGWLFRWLAPDGSAVLAVNQCEGYCNAGGLGFAEIWHAHTRRTMDLGLATGKVRDLFEKMEQRPGAFPALLNNGCDHFPPQQDFGAVLQALREAFPGTEFSHGRFEDFLAAARADVPDAERPEHQGELLGGRDHLILSGVWSTRMYLKQENELVQGLLARAVEPLTALTHFLHGDPYPAGLIDDAWRSLLRNHPHDSICGCSTDAVHKDNETRFAAARQAGEQLLSRLMDRLTPTFGRREQDDRRIAIAVANPLPIARDEVVERLVVLPPPAFDLTALRLVDEDGAEVPCEFLDRLFVERFWGIDYRAELYCEDQLSMLDTYLDRFGDRILGDERDQDTKDCFLHIRFPARNLPAVGHRQFFLEERPEAPRPSAMDPVRTRASRESMLLENHRLKVEVFTDGTFDLHDKGTDRHYRGLNMLEDTEDTGDEYDHGPAEVSGAIFSAGTEGKVRLLYDSALSATAEAVFRMNIPRSLERDRKSRQQRDARCDVRVRVTLRSGARRVDIETDFNNHAFDHRLRVWFPTGLNTDTVHSDGHFLINRRPLERPTKPEWPQPAPPTWPQQDFTALSEGKYGLAVLNRGLPEFQTWSDQDGHAIYAMTLLRCVDWLSRDDFAARKNTNAGPTLHTPDAQCYGRHTFRYAVAPFSGDLLEAGIKDESERYRTEVLTHQGVADQQRPGGVSLVRKSDPRVAITAIKKAERGDHLILRLCNLSNTALTENLHFQMPVLEACTVDLLEEPLPVDCLEPSVTHGGTRLAVPLDPHKIITLAVHLADDEGDGK